MRGGSSITAYRGAVGDETWFPDERVPWMAENTMAGLHNVHTLRGAPLRNPLNG